MYGDSATAFLDAAGRYQVLRKDSEIHLGTLVRTWLDSDNPSPSQVRAGQRAKRTLFQCNLRLVVARSKVFLARARALNVEHGDLLQEGCLGLNRACEKFDPARGRAFSTYCVPWLDQAMRRHLEGRAGTVRIPGNRVALQRRWRYRPEGQSTCDFAAQFGYKVDEVETTLRLLAQANCTSLNARLSTSDDGGSVLDVVASPDHQPSTDTLDMELVLNRLAAALPSEMALIREVSAAGTVAAAARERGVRRGYLNGQVSAARRRLMAVAGPEALALLGEAA